MSQAPMSVAEVDALSADAFLAAFADVAEDSAWVADAASGRRPFETREAMIAAFAKAIDEAGRPHRMALLNAHPDLAGRAAVAGDIGDDSRREQADAGLDRLSEEEFARFVDMNAEYRTRFGFPFILAVRGAKKQAILEAFEARLANDPQTEFDTALDQVKRIVRFRIEERVA